MAAAGLGLTPKARFTVARFWVELLAVHDRTFTDAHKQALKYIVIRLSIAGFAAHLLLIMLARAIEHPPAILQLIGRNYLDAIATPFNFILFYEVLTLIAALPASTTRSIANQFEIVSLIFARNTFTDVAEASEAVKGHVFNMKMAPLLADMWAGLGMFLLVAIFQWVAQKRPRPRGTAERSRRLDRFITQKKIVAVGLSSLLLAMAAYYVGLFVLAIGRTLLARHPVAGPVGGFYNDLFTVMIFTDVLILILSLVVSGQYEMVFRNAAFVVSIILIRFSLAEEHPYGAALAVLGMVFGILTLLVFNLHMKVQLDSGG